MLSSDNKTLYSERKTLHVSAIKLLAIIRPHYKNTKGDVLCSCISGLRSQPLDHLEDPGVDGRIILKRIFERLGGGHRLD
jgi:hypothetical protein